MMRTFDFAPYRRSTVGFDHLFDLLESSMRSGAADNYPPVNIERLGEDQYRITLAVAGFSREDLDIVAQQNMLTISGRKADEPEQSRQYLHQGIGARSFERRFELADFVRVQSADLKDGLLMIDLVREIPDAMRPRRVEIGGNVHQLESDRNTIKSNTSNQEAA
jgi:molecular chaperone IbpA